MAQLDDIVGSVMKNLKDNGLDDNTIVVFTTDNGAENFTWPDGGQTPFAGGKGTALEGGFRVPGDRPLAGQGAGRQGRERHHLRARLVPDPASRRPATRTSSTSCSRASRSATGPTRSTSTATTRPTLITGKGPSKRHEIFYFTEGTLGAVRIDDYKYRFTDQPNGWLGGTVKVDWPILVNLRLDPFERTGMPDGKGGSLAFYNWFAYEFWRFVFVQQEVGKAAQTFIEFPPMQKGASFNLEAVKAQIEKTIASRRGD